MRQFIKNSYFSNQINTIFFEKSIDKVKKMSIIIDERSKKVKVKYFAGVDGNGYFGQNRGFYSGAYEAGTE